MKRLSYILSLLVVVSMFLAACAPAATEESPAATEAASVTDAPAATEAAPAELSGTLNVWSFTNEIRTMAIAFEGVHPNVDVVYTMIPMTNG